MARAPKLSPYFDASASPADVSALQALYHGRADEHQQKRALNWILTRACRSGSPTFDENPHVSAFLQGRWTVGLIIMNAMRTSAEAAKALEDQQKKE